MAGSLFIFWVFVYQILLLKQYHCHIEYEEFVGLVLVCRCSFILYDSSVWAVLNWQLLIFQQELHLMDVCFQICDYDSVLIWFPKFQALCLLSFAFSRS